MGMLGFDRIIECYSLMQRKSVGLFKKLVKQIKADENDAMMDEVQAILDNADEVLARFASSEELAVA